MFIRRQVILGLLLMSLLAADGKPARDLTAVAVEGTKLTDDQARAAVAAEPKNPEDAELHAKLLGFYQVRKAGNREARTKDILWMIENRPADSITTTVYCMIDPADDADGYTKGKEIWDRQLGAHSTDAVITANGASFRAAADFPAAESLLAKAESLEPKNAAWPERAALMEEKRIASHPNETAKLAAKALQERQTAFAVMPDPQHRFHVLIRMPDDAVLAEDYMQAKRLGKQLIGTAEKFRDDPAYGDAIHRGNIDLGEEALAAGRVDRAEEYLTAAGETPGSPTLATVGPDLQMAKKLLARGERTAVRAYLSQCTKFWKDGEQRLKSWISTLDSGGTPEL